MSTTSLAAYRVVRATARATHSKIMDFATKRGRYGLTADELAAAWCCCANHTAPRLCELLKSGHLVATGRTRPTRAGHAARVLIAKQFAQPAPAQPELALAGMQNARYPA
jgi:hypothetical protein